jgi:hypothetical protein
VEYQGSEARVLTNEEFLTMLAASGIDSWYGTDLEEERKALESDRAYNKCLASLYKKELIDWKNDKAVISEACKPIFMLLKESKMAIVVSTADRAAYVTSFYLGEDNLVSVESRNASAGELEIGMHDKKEWVTDLMDSIYLPTSSVAAAAEEIDDLSIAPGDYYCKFDLIKLPSGDLVESMKVADSGVYSIIETSNGRENYSADRVAEMLRLWSGGSE